MSNSLIKPPVKLFQNLIFLSAVPPPLAKIPRWCGDQAIALTAARCSQNRHVGLESVPPHTNNLLSLPPEANWSVSVFHRNPHTSCLWCPASFLIYCSGARVSRCSIVRSREPDDRMWLFHAKQPTLPEWPDIVRIFLQFSASQISTDPLWVPIASVLPCSTLGSTTISSDSTSTHPIRPL